MMINLFILQLLFYSGVLVTGKTRCICADDALYQELCTQGKEIIKNSTIQLQFLACYCVCPSLRSVKVIYPWVAAMKWDMYHNDQLNFFKAVHKCPVLKAGGIIMAGWGDHSTLSVEVRNQLKNINIVMASHSLLKSEVGERNTLPIRDQELSVPPTFKNVILIPDHLFIRYNGYSHLIRHFNRPDSLPYDERKSLILWRGSPNGRVYGEVLNLRYLMCLKAKSLPWLDVGLTKAYNSESEQLYRREGVIKSAIPETDWSNYKGIIDIDGSVNAWGLIWRLASGSTVFLIESNFTNAYMEHLRPFIHYIPLKADLSDFETMTQMINQSHSFPLLAKVALNAKLFTENFTLEKEIVRVARELNFYWNSTVISIID